MLSQKIVSDLMIQSLMKFANHSKEEELPDVFGMTINFLDMSTNDRRSAG